jgi:aspartate racemase
MGIFASLKFVEEFYAFFQDSPDHKKPRIILDINTSIPSRGRHILYGEPSPVPEILKALKVLNETGGEILTAVCNSATALLKAHNPQPRNNFVDIIEATSLAIPSSQRAAQKCLVIGGQVTFQLDPYRKHLEAKGFNQIQLTGDDQTLIELHIESVKQSGFSREAEKSLGRMLVNFQERYDAELILLACTELDLSGENFFGTQIINSRLELASHIFTTYYQRLK